MDGSNVHGPGVCAVKNLLILPAAFAFAAPALAEDDATNQEITVVATGSDLPVDQAGQPVTVISADDLEKLQGADITRVLVRVPGLTLSRNGGQGAFTGVRLRGSESEQVLVLVDGVRVEDVSAPSGGFDFGTLSTGGIERIDVLRGSNSVVWGSAAIGGVIAVQSRELNGVDAVAEAGSGNSYTADATGGIANDRYALSLNGGYGTSDGLSSAAAIGTERDGFRLWRVGGKGRFEVVPGLSLVAAARYADTKTDIDGFPPPTFFVFDDTPEFQITRQFSGRAGLRYEGGGLTINTGYSLAETKRDYYDPTFGTAPSFGYRAHSERADLTGRVQLPAKLALDFGGDSEWTRYSGTFDAEQRARLSSVHGLLGWYGERLTVAAGLRYDDHSRFGSATTFGANGSLRLSSNLRLRASYGEGFKAPTLFQLLSDFGNAGLVPERARSYDAGIEWNKGPVRAGLTYYRRDSRNLIGFVSCFGVTTGICTNRPSGTYDNIGKARAEGIEAEVELKPTEAFRVGLVYTYTKARNLTAGSANFGKDLARRPRSSLTASVDWTSPLHGLMLGADMHFQSQSFDDAGNFTRIESGTTAAVRASLPVTSQIEVFGRVENLFDSQVPTVAGYGVPGRAVYGGLRVRY